MSEPILSFEAPVVITRDDQPRAKRASPAAVIRSLGMPLFIFSLILSVLLVLSWKFLMPRLTRIEVGGEVRSSSQLRAHLDEVQAEILFAEERREDLILAVHDPQYIALKHWREHKMTLREWEEKIASIAQTVTDQPDAIHVSSLRLSPETKTVSLEGDVRFVGSQSMTLLAEFVDVLREQAEIANVDTPAFTREESESGPHSPFSLTLLLP